MAMRVSTVTFNGSTLNPKRFRIQHLPDYTIAERDLERLHVEGRDGDLVLDSKSYKNIPRKYSISFGADGPEDFASAVSEISKWLDCAGYCELEDTYDPEYFWLAVPSGAAKVYSLLNGYMGKVDVEFSCQPRKFLKYGRVPISRPIANAKGDLTMFRVFNPSNYDAKPLFYVYPKTSSSEIQNPKCTILVAENIAEFNRIPVSNTEYYELEIDLTDRILQNDDVGNMMSPFLALAIDCESENVYNAFDEKASDSVMGDVDGDGEVTTADAELALRAAIHLETLTAEQTFRADMDRDGVVTPKDAQQIMAKAKKTSDQIWNKNQNSLVKVGADGFPILKAQRNNIICFSGAVSRIAVIPRYWTR